MSHDDAREEWRDIPGWPGYMASSLGRVRSHRRNPEGSLLSTYLNPSNHYLIVGPSRNGHQSPTPIHVLVALAFHGERPAGMEVRHLDGSRENNTAANLAWGTHSENILDAVRHGTHYRRPRPERCPGGHAYDAQNTYVRPDGGARCRACDREQVAARRARRRAEIAAASSRELRAA